MKFEEEALSYFSQWNNCSQSTFAPFAKKLGLDLDTAFKLATPFGGGMGHAGQMCGAVCGGLLAIGLAKGISEDDGEKKQACYALAKEFQDRFFELHGDLTCPVLLGRDISDPAQLEEVRKEDLFNIICPVFVEDAVRIVSELLEIDNRM